MIWDFFLVAGKKDCGKASAKAEPQCIRATTLDEYRKHIKKDPALERRLKPVKVPESTANETIQILKDLCERYEKNKKNDVLVAAAQLSYQSVTAYSLTRQFTLLMKLVLVLGFAMLSFLKRPGSLTKSSGVHQGEKWCRLQPRLFKGQEDTRSENEPNGADLSLNRQR